MATKTSWRPTGRQLGIDTAAAIEPIDRFSDGGLAERQLDPAQLLQTILPWPVHLLRQ